MNDHNKHAKLAIPAWSETTSSLCGLVLAGGESRRMGRNKALIKYHGKTQTEYLTDLLRSEVNEVFISAHPDRIPFSSERIIRDTFLDLGPLSGVLSAFRFNPDCAWITVACDMPFLDGILIRQLITERDPSKLATCFHDPSTGFPEPLLTIWEPQSYPVLLSNLSKGISCLRKTLINNDVKILHAVRPGQLKNINTPEESEMYFKDVY